MYFLNKLNPRNWRWHIREDKRPEFYTFLGVLVVSVLLASTAKINLTGAMFIVVSVLGLFLYTFLIIWLWVKAGAVVFRSLVVPSVVVSIVFFLSQSYCSLPPDQHIADKALLDIFVIGILYALYLFYIALRKELLGEKEHEGILYKIGKDKHGKVSWFIVVLYAFLFGMLLVELTQVATPIIANICIFKT